MNMLAKLEALGYLSTPIADGPRWGMRELRHPSHARGWWILTDKATGKVWRVAALEEAQVILDREEALLVVQDARREVLNAP